MTKHRLAYVVAILVGALALPGCLGSSSEEDDNSVSILSPKRDALVTAKTMTVKVRAAEGGPFRAVLDGRDVSKRFRGSSGGVRSATFRRGRDFDLGRDSLTVEVGEPGSPSPEIASTIFHAARRADGRIRVTRSGRRAALPVRTRSSHRIVDQRVWVNGRRAGGQPRAHGDGRGFSTDLGARHGLHYGGNRVTTEVQHGDGAVARTTRTFNVPHSRPLAEAGPDRRTARGRSVRLDGSRTRARRGARGLSYRWRLASAPKGSKARLAATTARTSFKPDVPGRYRLELEASAAGAPRTAVDQVAVTARPTDDPMGVPIQTISKEQGIQVGGDSYPKKGGWVRLLVLDPVTLKPVPGGDQGFDIDSAGQIGPAIVGAGDDDIVVMTGQGIDQGNDLPEQSVDALEKAFAALGGPRTSAGPPTAQASRSPRAPGR